MKFYGLDQIKKTIFVYVMNESPPLMKTAIYS